METGTSKGKKQNLKTKKQKLENKKQNLKSFLEKTLLAIDFNNLHKTLGVKTNRLTFLFNNPTKARYEEVKHFAELAKISPHQLVNITACGVDNLTLAEGQSLKIRY